MIFYNLLAAYRECFLTIEEMENVKKFKSAINRSFSSRGGILAHGVSDSQLSSYIMKKMNAFSVRQGRDLVASLVIGRQPNLRTVNSRGEFVDDLDPSAVEEKLDDPDTAVYILNEKLQVNFLSLKPQNVAKEC